MAENLKIHIILASYASPAHVIGLCTSYIGYTTQIVITGCTVAAALLHCNDDQQNQWETEILTPCRSETHKNIENQIWSARLRHGPLQPCQFFCGNRSNRVCSPYC